jgi:hypothetical protein
METSENYSRIWIARENSSAPWISSFRWATFRQTALSKIAQGVTSPERYRKVRGLP